MLSCCTGLWKVRGALRLMKTLRLEREKLFFITDPWMIHPAWTTPNHIMGVFIDGRIQPIPTVSLLRFRWSLVLMLLNNDCVLIYWLHYLRSTIDSSLHFVIIRLQLNLTLPLLIQKGDTINCVSRSDLL